MTQNRFREYVLNPVSLGMKSTGNYIPLFLDRVSDTFNLHKARYTLIGGNTGSGKTAFVDAMYVLEVYDWWISTRHVTGIKINWLYFSMERRKEFKLAKWTCYKLYKDHGILVDVNTIMGYKNDEKIHKALALKIASYENYFNEMLEHVNIIDGPQTPVGMATSILEYADKVGKTKYMDINGKKCFHSFEEYDPNTYTFIIGDHVGKTNSDGYPNKKAAIDDVSQIMSAGRDRYKFSPVMVSQFNRAIGDTQRMSIFRNDLSPILEDFKDSGNTQEDADLVLALFNPYRYKAWNKDGNYLNYPIRDEMVAPSGHNRFRSLSVLKNSYGLDDMVYGLKFLGECGHFRTLPKPDDPMLLQQELDLISEGR